MAQQYSLKWNNHQPNFISMFAMLRSTRTLVDVTLSAEGRQIHAHKMVLSACSPYFHSLFVDNPTQHTIVILKDVAFSDLNTIVDFMYYGEVNITHDELPQMLDSAKSLKVKGLTETESTSVMRSQSSEFAYETSGEAGGESAELPSEPPAHAQETCAEPPSDPHNDERRGSASPGNSPSAKRKRRRKSSNASTSLNMVGEEHGMPEVRDVTVSSLPRRRDFDDSGAHTQNTEPMNISIDDLNVEHNTANMPQGGQWSMMEHTYPRYSNSCFGGGGGGGGMQNEGGVHAHYMSNMMHSHMEGEAALGQYAALGVAPSPADAAPHAEPAPAPPKRRRTTNPQSEENFQRALEAVRIGGIGFCKAARMFGVNNRTLWLEYKKKGYPNNRPSIKARIKREHASPPHHKEEAPPPEPHMLLCHAPHAAHHAPPHAAHHLSVGFVDSRPLDLPLQGMNILGGLSFNTMQ